MGARLSLTVFDPELRPKGAHICFAWFFEKEKTRRTATPPSADGALWSGSVLRYGVAFRDGERMPKGG
jgi:hypothetical protein